MRGGGARVQAGRRMTMVEVVDVIPTGCSITAVVWRKGSRQPQLLPCTYQCSAAKQRISRVFELEPMTGRSRACPGALSSNLMEHFAECNESSECNNLQRFKDWDHMFDKRVVITNIFANTDTFNLQCVQLGDTVKAVEIFDASSTSLGKIDKLETLEQLRGLPWQEGEYVTIDTSSKTRVALHLPQSLQQDKEVCEAYGIHCTPFMTRIQGARAPEAAAKPEAAAAKPEAAAAADSKEMQLCAQLIRAVQQQQQQDQPGAAAPPPAPAR